MNQPKTRKAPAKPLTPAKFRNILRAVDTAKRNGKTIASVAERQGVSVETVNTVRRTVTWSGFVKYKKSLRTQKNGSSKPAKAEPAEVAKAAQVEDPKPQMPAVTLEEFAQLQRKVVDQAVTIRDLKYSTSRNSADLERLSSWVKAIDTRLSNLRSRAVKWPWGRPDGRN
ncbi:hypothetical protein [Streptomyces turgidiscabies]|uniref:hypothetical protein n=1 Tax=Streptomyces turgidiscabies TaxID=85558 RepID=UPI0038F64A54